jgi:hypothetical protein
MTTDHEDRKFLLSLPGVERITRPIIGLADRNSAADIIGKYKPLAAELLMERMVEGLVTDEPQGTFIAKFMAPYMFKKEAQLVEMKNIDGEATPEAASALEAYIKAGRAAEGDGGLLDSGDEVDKELEEWEGASPDAF